MDNMSSYMPTLDTWGTTAMLALHQHVDNMPKLCSHWLYKYLHAFIWNQQDDSPQPNRYKRP